MGRKAKFETKVKSGPGRKSKKQQPPQIPKRLQVDAEKGILKRTKKKKDKNAAVVKKLAQKKSEKSVEGPKKLSLPLEDEDIEDIPSDNDSSDDFMKDDFGSEVESENEIEEQKPENKEEDDELMINVTKSEQYVLPTSEEMESQETVTDLSEVNQRIKDVVQVLSDFTARHQEGRSRKEYIDVLVKDLCLYYSYNEFLIEKLMTIFSIPELIEFLEASEVQRPVTVRANSLKTRRRDLAQALINRGINLDPIGKWTKEGLVIYDSQVPIGATPEYLAGHYILQGAVSMMPVLALAPQPNEKVLDLCSAPGGKASHIAALMKNTGVLFANDSNADRAKAVVGNFHRLGVTNSVICNYDGRKFSSVKKGFDRCLLDAPCSGTGVISKDPSVKTNKDDKDIKRCSHIQRELILSAIDSVDATSKTGGIIVYSTCSILPEENESVIQFALNKRNVKIVPTDLDFGVEGLTKYQHDHFHPQMKQTRRYYPHSHNLDGFFVAKLKKFSNTIPKSMDSSTPAESVANGQTEEPEKTAVLPKQNEKSLKKKSKKGGSIKKKSFKKGSNFSKNKNLKKNVKKFKKFNNK